MKVLLLATTAMRVVPDVGLEPQEGVDSAEFLLEFAGRNCYQSFDRPNPKTASTASYIKHIIDVGHLSVLEHASATFYVTGVSRSLTHELVRHRHLSFSQLSQRYVAEPDGFVVPSVISDDKELMAAFGEVATGLKSAYTFFLNKLGDKLGDKKAIRQAARFILPNATETKIVVTGNFRAWRHFIDMRATEHADVEIRDLAVEIAHQLQEAAPSVFGDYTDCLLSDGSIGMYRK